jgi:hypothetical protein
VAGHAKAGRRRNRCPRRLRPAIALEVVKPTDPAWLAIAVFLCRSGPSGCAGWARPRLPTPPVPGRHTKTNGVDADTLASGRRRAGGLDRRVRACDRLTEAGVEHKRGIKGRCRPVRRRNAPAASGPNRAAGNTAARGAAHRRPLPTGSSIAPEVLAVPAVSGRTRTTFWRSIPPEAASSTRRRPSTTTRGVRALDKPRWLMSPARRLRPLADGVSRARWPVPGWEGGWGSLPTGITSRLAPPCWHNVDQMYSNFWGIPVRENAFLGMNSWHP